MKHRRRQHGFTLIEVLIATAVLALALGSFIAAGAHYADYARYIHDKTLAQWVARNRLVKYQLTSPWPDTGDQEGDADMGLRRWHWTAEIQESPNPAVRRIDVHVFRIDDESGEPETESLVTLSGFVTRSDDGAFEADDAGG